MIISIIGTSSSGKTMLFEALSGLSQRGQTTKGPPTAVIDVPDERLDALSAIFKPRKTTYARITVNDTPPLNPKLLSEMRLSDAFLVVLRNFDNGNPRNPVGELLTISNEFILSDMAQVETRLERIRKQGTRGNTAVIQEEAALAECYSHLGEGNPLCTLASLQEDDKSLRGFQFLSLKPMMILVNSSEEDFQKPDSVLAGITGALPPNAAALAACVKLEAELAFMERAEQEAFMEEYGIKESLRGRIIRLAMDTLGLISFFTVGDDECRAWPIPKGSSAQEAAGAIHTDLAQKFIRAETVSYADFMAHNGIGGCKKLGLWRLEGKTYTVKDGDILTIRAGA